MKKFFLAAFVMAALMICPVASVQAYNYDCGVYPESGLRAYLMTETVKLHDQGFNCTVVCYPSERAYYIDYNFWGYNFTNSDGYEARRSYQTPVEQNIWNYVTANFRRPGGESWW